MKDFETIFYTVKEGIATITLNRPEQLNAFNKKMQEDLCSAFDCCDADDDVKVVIVTGTGRAFCAGADLSTGAETFANIAQTDGDPMSGKVGDVVRDIGGLLTLRIYRSLKPVIAAINGPAVGIGATMLLPMDIRIASTQSKFGFVFTRRGIVPEAASSWFLSRAVGISTALEWCYSGRVFLAQEALERGLVRSLHAPDELLTAAQILAAEIVQNTAPVSVSATRQMFWRMAGADHPMKAHQLESRVLQERGKSADAIEGINSFLEKRSPAYPNRVSTDMPELFDWQSEPPFI